MRLSSVLWMVLTPLAATLAAVLLLTPSDILRRPVITAEWPVQRAAPKTAPVQPETATPTALFVPELRPATLTVVASTGAFPPQVDSRAPATPKVAADQRWIAAGALNLRSGPGQAHAPVTSLRLGTAVTVLESAGNWVRVEHEGTTGWLSARYLSNEPPRRN
jgi:hypothetical protein